MYFYTFNFFFFLSVKYSYFLLFCCQWTLESKCVEQIFQQLAFGLLQESGLWRVAARSPFFQLTLAEQSKGKEQSAHIFLGSLKLPLRRTCCSLVFSTRSYLRLHSGVLERSTEKCWPQRSPAVLHEGPGRTSSEMTATETLHSRVNYFLRSTWLKAHVQPLSGEFSAQHWLLVWVCLSASPDLKGLSSLPMLSSYFVC